jgi:hypothetical protein
VRVGELLNWIGRPGKPLEEVSLEDISEYFQMRGSIEALRCVAAISLTGLL